MLGISRKTGVVLVTNNDCLDEQTSLEARRFRKRPHMLPFRIGCKMSLLRFPIFAAALSGFILACFEAAHAHGGGLDSLGCHNHKKRGEFHCHQGKLAGRSFASKEEAEMALSDEQPISSETSSGAIAYNRDLYGSWIDEDGDCQNTRQEVLIAESTEPVMLAASGCRVVSGRWEDPYTGRVFTDPASLDIDHFIPLAEVHRSGGSAWSSERRRQYANDLSNPDTLQAVSASVNRSKGDRDPVNWLPPNRAYRCAYLETWVGLKRFWELFADPAERKFLSASRCPAHK